jgi:flagellar hook-associated protein 3 FlgL
MSSIGRTTLPGIYGRIATQVSKNQVKLADAYQEITSGKAINRPSDDPIGTLQVMTLRRDNVRQVMYASAAEDARQILDASDSALQEASEILNSAMERLTQAGGIAGQDSTTREALASEIDQLRNELLSIANRTHLDRPLFSGTTTPTPTFDSNGNYLGNSDPILRDVAEGETLQITTPGDQVFGSGPTGMIAALTTAADAIRNNDSAGRATAMATFVAGQDTFAVAMTEVGARQRRVDSAIVSADARQLANAKDISNVEDVDFAEATIRLKAMELTYQATLAAAGKVSQFTLLDFLR